MAVPPARSLAVVIRLARFVHAFAPGRTMAALAFMVLGTLTEGVSIVMLMPIITLIGHVPGTPNVVALPTGRLGGWLPPMVPVSLGVVLAAFVLLVALRAMLMRIKDLFTTQLLYDFTNGMRGALFASIAHARWETVTRMRVSDLDHALTADMDRLQAAAMQLLMLIQSIVLLVIYLGISSVLSPTLTAFAGVVGVVSLLILRPIRRRAMQYGRALTVQRQDQYRIVSQFLGGMKVAKSFGAEQAYIAQLRATLDAMRDGVLRFMRVQTAGATGFQIVSALALAGFVYLALEYLALSQASIIVMIFLMMRLAPRFIVLQATMQEVLVNVAAFETMQQLRAQCDGAREQEAPARRETIVLEDAIGFDDVTFRYGGNAAHAVLCGVSFAIPARAITAILGPSGSGKSTIADMLLGLLEPEKGSIRIDSRPLPRIDRASWRAEVVYVPQDVVLMHDTIAANLAIARPDATVDEMWAALAQANAAAFVGRLPEGLDTIVGERGLRLSGGERQRISLARALLRRPLLLILDEATSALDAENRDLVVQALDALRGRMTIVLIAHDRSVTALADHVVRVEEGRVVTHDAPLMAGPAWAPR